MLIIDNNKYPQEFIFSILSSFAPDHFLDISYINILINDAENRTKPLELAAGRVLFSGVSLDNNYTPCVTLMSLRTYLKGIVPKESAILHGA
ncbi:hypothetical protein C3432_15250 [Citrobacter amalonaticus]|uniref:Uncharacterized protein n=1 Tax=Citrobacter amalonaticus TaxID=35703 RepID=A0A2S4RTL0_CITAM|nr:hypothetical protein [Citrobacter amalonaticus]POT56746.1 hypothetical protein C3432_15250 [Citrobacter amalonaticus]POT72009.1 hypothetical protein C3436_22615 [Citrobacter amalonaticus]POU63148.1 hypothetical protein C3430_20865 [Citrobacter amalonaticus]POV04638.1 hypothetical protein C3424_16050 [Citrobacter amalonaticus]